MSKYRKLILIGLAWSIGCSQSSQPADTPVGPSAKSFKSEVKRKAATVTVPPLAAPPTFVKNDEGLALVEALAEPPSFVNGSSIDIWIYREDDTQQAKPATGSEAVEDTGRDDDENTEAGGDAGNDADASLIAQPDLEPGHVTEVAISGHAESRTCRVVTALVLNAMLQKTSESRDLFVAGAAELFNAFDPDLDKLLREHKSVKEYIQVEEDLRIEMLLQQLWERFGGPTDGENPLVGERQAKLKELKKRAEELKVHADVARYVKNRNSEDALNEFIAEAQQVASGSGLIRFHEVPASTARLAREQIVDLAMLNSAAVHSFRGLLDAADIEEAIIYTPVLLLSSGDPLVITIDKEGISGENFAEAVRENQSELEVAMIGDANRRIERFERLKTSMDEQADHYRSMPQAKRERLMLELNSTILGDGQQIETRRGTPISAQDYLEHRIPSIKKWADEEIARANELMETIHDDRNDEAGIIQETGVVTVVESMLRDWDLSVARSQLAFDRWKTIERRPVWNRIYDELKEQGVEQDALRGEDMVFHVKQSGDKFEIRPMHMIDLSRSALVIQPKVGCTQVESTWGRRQLRPRTAQRQVTMEEIWGARDTDAAAGLLKEYLRASPDEAIKLLEGRWHRSNEQIVGMSQDIEELVKPRVALSNYFEELEALRSDPTVEDDDIKYLNGLYLLVEKHDGAPVDARMSLAHLLAGYVAAVQNKLNEYKLNEVELDDWGVLQAYARRRGGDPYARANKLLNDIEEISLPFNAGDVIRDAIETCRKREPSFLEHLLTNKAFPDDGSNELKLALGKSEREITLFEMEALQLVQVRELLHKRVILLDAAIELWLSRDRYLSESIRLLAEADYAGVTGRDNSIQAVLHALEIYSNGLTSPDSIARVSHATSLEQSAESNMRRASALLEDKYCLPGHQQLAARIFYEMGAYEGAFQALFADRTTLAQYSPNLQWSELTSEPQLGTIRALEVGGDAHELILTVEIESERQPERSVNASDAAAAGSHNAQNGEEPEGEVATEGVSEVARDGEPETVNDGELTPGRAPTSDSDSPADPDGAKTTRETAAPAESAGRNGNVSVEDDDPFGDSERKHSVTPEREIKTIKLLSLTGLESEELKQLRGHLETLDVTMLDGLGSAQDQVLRASLPLDGHRRRLHQIVNREETKRLLVKVLAYGRSVPAENIVRKGGRHGLEDDQRKIFDRTRSSSGRELYEPSLDELMSMLQSTVTPSSD